SDLFVEGLEPRLDDLVDHGCGLSLGAKFVSKYALLARHDGRVEAGRINGERTCGCDVHRDLAAKFREFLGLALRLQPDQHTAPAGPIFPRPPRPVLRTWLAPPPLSTLSPAARRPVMFSPPLAPVSAIASVPVMFPALAALMASALAPTLSATCAIILTSP